MRKNFKTWAALAAAAAAMGMISACGFGQSPAPQAGGGKAADVQAVIDAGVLKVGVKTDLPNFSLQNTATGEYEGFEDDLAYEMAGEIFGCTAQEARERDLVEFTGVTAKTRGPLIENGELDMVIATFTITDERKELYNFTTPYYTDAVGLMVLADSGIDSIGDLDGKVIGVAQGSTSEESFKAYVKEQGMDVEPVFETFDGYPALAAALASKNIDVFSVDRAILSAYMDGTTRLLDERYAEQEYGVVTSLEDKGLAQVAEGVIQELSADGRLKNMLTEWGIK